MISDSINPTINFATQKDIDWVHQKHDLDKQTVIQKIDRQEYIIAKIDNKSVGFLRFTLLWAQIPFIGMIRVESEYQRKGIGKGMLAFLEDYAVKNGYKVIMSSSQQDEPEPQEWHRKMGFKDAGIIEHFEPIQDVPEIIFIKNLKPN